MVGVGDGRWKKMLCRGKNEKEKGKLHQKFVKNALKSHWELIKMHNICYCVQQMCTCLAKSSLSSIHSFYRYNDFQL